MGERHKNILRHRTRGLASAQIKHVEILKRLIRRIIDAIEPPQKAAPCPSCGCDLALTHIKRRTDKDDLIFMLCQCGRASAWSYIEGELTLIYGSEPEDLYDD